MKSELIPEKPDLKCEDSKAGDNGVERCEGTDETSCPETCLASGIGPEEQGVMAEAGARCILSPEIKAEIIEYIQAFAVAIVLAAFIITFIAQTFVVEGSSMEPSLHNRERLIVNKLVYRFRKPNRGDVVVFRYPANPKRRFIKRVIGIPGDEVEVRDGFVILNGMTLTEDYTMDLTYGYFGPKQVPDGHYFVLGDNRNNSDDSRYPDVGFVPMANIVGKAGIVWWPPRRMSIIRNPLARLMTP